MLVKFHEVYLVNLIILDISHFLCHSLQISAPSHRIISNKFLSISSSYKTYYRSNFLECHVQHEYILESQLNISDVAEQISGN